LLLGCNSVKLIKRLTEAILFWVYQPGHASNVTKYIYKVTTASLTQFIYDDYLIQIPKGHIV